MRSTNNSGRIAGRGVLVLDRLYRTLTHYLRTKPEFGRGRYLLSTVLQILDFTDLVSKRYHLGTRMAGTGTDLACSDAVETLDVAK
jgi:hypothetical protein